MTAKKMFEELRYGYGSTSSVIWYIKKTKECDIYIEFDLLNKSLLTYVRWLCGLSSYKSMTEEESKAIHQQMKELGWPE